ncbi:hypothetical protein IAD21_06069 [Abditibacteriota bacterium]|nr:hypothetical protein IAD21_06069 [Abditibacteriota bacterium]
MCYTLRWWSATQYETLVLEVEFTPEGEIEPDKTAVHTVASLRDAKSPTFSVELAVNTAMEEA